MTCRCCFDCEVVQAEPCTDGHYAKTKSWPFHCGAMAMAYKSHLVTTHPFPDMKEFYLKVKKENGEN
jgi:hypothetical protein